MIFDAILAGDPVQRGADAVHDALPFGSEQRGEFDPAKLVANLGAKDWPQLLGQLLLGAGADVHQERIDDSIASEGVDLQPALVGRKHLLTLHVHVLDALVDPDELVDERYPPADPRTRSANRPAGLVLIEDSDRLTEADDDGLLGLGDDRKACEHQAEHDEGQNGRHERPAANEADHCGRSG